MDYNLGPHKKCLVGNWNEEHSLHDYAGHYRTAPSKAFTHVRCVEHTVRYDTKELISSQKKDFCDPKDPLNPLVYKPESCMGARERMINAKLAAIHSQPPEVPEPARKDWGTTHSTTYAVPNSDDPQYATTKGMRRMRTQDNVPRTYRDRTFLLETGIAAPHFCLEGADGGETAAKLEDLAQSEVPITVYSANVATAQDVTGVTNTQESRNPFAKHSAFSQPIEHYTRGGTWKDL